LAEAEIGLPLARIPEGAYGFTTSAATSEIAVFREPVFRSFEVHRLPGGVVQFIGYVTQQDHLALTAGTEPVTINLYPDPVETASNLVAVPVSRIDRKRPPLRDAGSPMPIEIAPES